MAKPEDYSDGNIDSQYCSSCTYSDGSLKSLDEITLHIANQLIMSQGIDREAATKAARSILSMQPEWKVKLGRQEHAKSKRNKILFASVVSLLVIALIASLTWKSTQHFNRIYYWDMPEPTQLALFADVKPVVTKQNHSGVDVTRVSFPESQFNIRIDKNDNSVYFQDYMHSQTGYRLYLREDRINGIKVSNEENRNFLYIGSILEGNNHEKAKLFWARTDENNIWQLVESQKNIDETATLADNVDPFNVVICGKYLVWIESGDKQNSINTVKAFNTSTSKIFVVQSDAGFKDDLKTSDNFVYWSDYGNPNIAGFEILGFDFGKMALVRTGINSFFEGERGEKPKHLGSLGNQSYRKFISNIPDSWSIAEDFIIKDVVGEKSKVLMHNIKTGASKIIDFGSDFYNPRKIINFDYSKNATKTLVNTGMICSDSSHEQDSHIAWLLHDYSSFTTKIASKKVDSLDKPPKIIDLQESFNFNTELLKISNNWLVWISYDGSKSQVSNPYFDYARIFCTNLETGQQIELGDYWLKSERINLEIQDNLIAWTGWTEDSDYDIFFTKLP
jgi:hypothetical protein